MRPEGPLVGGVSETQDILDICTGHNIVPGIKVIHEKDASGHFKVLYDEGQRSKNKQLNKITAK
jgi:hypothetical protein